MIPELWTDADEERHLEDCPNPIDITEMGNSKPRLVCGCGEASRHTPQAVARAEVDILTTKVDPR